LNHTTVAVKNNTILTAYTTFVVLL